MKDRLFSRYLRTVGINKIICFCLSIVVLPLAGCLNPGVIAPAEKNSLESELGLELQQILDSAITDKKSKYPGVILRIETPAGTWHGTSGVASVETKSGVDPAAKFRAASILKPFVATVILQLVEEGKLSLDDRLPNLLGAEIAGRFEYGSDITLKMLLNHTSGIGEWVGSYDLFMSSPQSRIWRDEEFIELAVKAGTNFKPGEQYTYNNTEYTLLGMVIDCATGLPWRENIRQRLFAKLELKNTLLPEPGNVEIPGSQLRGYEMFNGALIDTTEIDPSIAGAAGGHSLVTNTEDLAIFMQALLKGVFFESPETLSIMLTGVETGPGRSYGLGVGRITAPNGSYAYGHTGGTAGYASMAYHFPEEDITVTTVISTDQFDSVLEYLLPSLAVIAESLKRHQ